MESILAAVFGLVAGLGAHDLAAQALNEKRLVPLTGTCPDCATTRGWQRPKCPHCSRTVGREAAIVVLAAVGAIAFTNTIGLTWSLIAYGGFLILSLALAITDIDAMRIVDRLNLRGTLILALALAVGSLLDGETDAFLRALLGAGVYFAGTNVMFLLVRGRGFGYGDVKLSVQLGLFTTYISWGTLGWAVFSMAMIGGVASLVVILLSAFKARSQGRRRSADSSAGLGEVMKTELPYGPAMIAGAWLAIFLAGIGAFPIPS